MSFSQALSNLQSVGLNIFLSEKVSKLPLEIRQYFRAEDQHKTLCLLGNGGPSMWESIDLSIPNPVDQFSVTEMKKFGSAVLQDDIQIFFPGDYRTLPLQQISRALGLSTASALGIDICEDYGPWFAFRGVFLTEQEIPLIKKENPKDLCLSCSKPCLQEKDFMRARLLCPVKPEEQYSLNQRQYHQSVLEKLKNLL